MPPASPIPRLVDVACERAARLLDESRPSREALALLVGAAEAVAPSGSAASILVIDRDGLLRNAASPNLPGDYLSAIDRLRPDPAVVTCAAALLTALSEEARDQKAAGGWSTIALGAAFVAAGVLVDSEYDAAYGPALWLGGVSAMAAGISTLLVRPPIQDFADEMGPAPVNLEAEWRARAEQAESERNTAVILDLGLGVGGATAATIFAAGAGDMPQSDRSKWVALTAMLGGAGFAGALYNILLESPIESGYRLAYPEPTTAAQPISVKVSTVRKGGALKLYGTF